MDSRNCFAYSFLVPFLSHMRRADLWNGSHQDPPPEHFLCFCRGTACGQSWTPRGVNCPVFLPLYGTACRAPCAIGLRLYFSWTTSQLIFFPCDFLLPLLPKRFLLRHSFSKSVSQEPRSSPLHQELHPKAQAWHREQGTLYNREMDLVVVFRSH